MFTQWWSTIPPISTKRTIISHFKPLNIKKRPRHMTFFLMNHIGIIKPTNCISGEMVCVLASSAVGRDFQPDRVKLKTVKLIFSVSSLSTHHWGVRASAGFTIVLRCSYAILNLKAFCFGAIPDIMIELIVCHKAGSHDSGSVA
jgi:hypothetical protein